jgi:hypothetical protein
VYTSESEHVTRQRRPRNDVLQFQDRYRRQRAEILSVTMSPRNRGDLRTLRSKTSRDANAVRISTRDRFEMISSRDNHARARLHGSRLPRLEHLPVFQRIIIRNVTANRDSLQ